MLYIQPRTSLRRRLTERREKLRCRTFMTRSTLERGKRKNGSVAEEVDSYMKYTTPNKTEEDRSSENVWMDTFATYHL